MQDKSDRKPEGFVKKFCYPPAETQGVQKTSVCREHFIYSLQQKNSNFYLNEEHALAV